MYLKIHRAETWGSPGKPSKREAWWCGSKKQERELCGQVENGRVGIAMDSPCR